MGRLALSPSLLLLLPALAFAQAAPPPLLQLQGRLTDSAGQPITSTTRDLRVEYWDSAIGGTSLGASNVVDPAITNGIYAVALAAPAGVFANNATVFMETAVGNGAAGADGAFEVLSPRIRVLASAYSLNADTLDGRDSASFAPAAGTFVQDGNSFAGLASLGTNDAFDLVLETGGAEVMRVTAGGSVGIGTTTPSVKLQVVGQTRSSSFSVADGTAGLPAYRFESDTDVGMFRPAANTLGLTTGGTERVTVGPAGEVSFQGNTLTFANPFGSGTVTTVANAAMTVASAGAGTLFLVAGATGSTRMQTGGADRLFITSAGDIGVGTTGPGRRLHVVTNDPAIARFERPGLQSAAIELLDPVGTTTLSGGGDGAGILGFRVAMAGTIQVAVLSTGEVGIGAPSPTARLHVRGPANDNLDVRLESDGFSQLLFRSDANSDTGGPYNWGVITRPDAGGRFEIRELAVPEPDGNRFVILPGGNVGIGTTTPGARLTVVAGATTDTLGANGASDGFDISEAISSAADVEVGDLVSADPATSQSVVRSRAPYDPALLGVITSKPAIAIGATDGNRHIALAGRVAVRVSGENGPVHRGDCLTSSSRPGYAMVATGPGRVVGVALGEFDGQGEGKVVVYVSPGWWDGGRTAELTSRLAEVEQENADLRERLARLEDAVARLGAAAVPNTATVRQEGAQVR